MGKHTFKLSIALLLGLIVLPSLNHVQKQSVINTNAAVTVITSKSSQTYIDTYYQSVDLNGTGSGLKSALETLLKNERNASFTYKTHESKVFPYTDVDPLRPNDGYIVSFYSGTPVKGYSGMNKEHTWPNSHGGGKIENDPHVIRPTLTSENSARGNQYFAETSSNGWDPASFNNVKYRGIAARIAFYGATIGATAGLILEDVGRGQGSGTGNRMGKLGDLLKWNLQYPVDQSEIIRNETLDISLNYNRNPFIDDPGLACKIWGATNTNTQTICATATPDPVESVKVTPSTGSVQINETLALTSSVLPSTATQGVTWTTSNASIATVSSTGVVTGKSVGTVSITATSTANTTKSSGATITVTNDPIPLQSIRFSESAKSLSIGSSATLSVTYTPSNASNKNVTWASSNQSVATVTSAGVVSAKEEGTALITATSAEGGFVASLTLTVTKVAAVTSIKGVFYNSAGNNDGSAPTATNLNNGSTVSGQTYLGFNKVNVVSSINSTQGYLPRGGGLAVGSSSNAGNLQITLQPEFAAKRIEVLFNHTGVDSTPTLTGRTGSGFTTAAGTIGAQNSNPSTGTPYVINFPEKETYFEINTSKRLAVVEINIMIESQVNETPLQAAEKWSQDFINNTNLGCLNKSDILLSSAWSSAQDAYFALSSGAQDIIQQNVPNSQGSVIEHALARYYVIMEGYLYNDFLNGELTKEVRTIKDRSITKMVIFTGFTYVIAASLFFIFFKKLKKQ